MPSMAQRVDPPLPQPPALSLLRSASLPTTAADDRDWALGIRYLPAADTQVAVDDYCGPSAGTFTYSGASEVEWLPYTVIAYDQCSALSSFARDYVARATALLEAATPKAVEKEFWAGVLAQAKGWPNLYLRHSRATDLTPGTVPSLNRAVGILEQALADFGFGAQGVVHGRVETLPNFTGARLDGSLLRTPRGTVVVGGTGYDGLGPLGNAQATPPAGQTWLYATGPVEYRQTPPMLFPDWPQGPSGMVPAGAVDKATNTVRLWAVRTALASWDGQCHFACRAVLPT